MKVLLPAGDEKAEPNFDYSVDSSAGMGIFTLRQCVYDEEYKNGLRDFFTAVQENNIRSVIVDLRNNPGGNSLVTNEFIRYLPAESYLTGACEGSFWKQSYGRTSRRAREINSLHRSFR